MFRLWRLRDHRRGRCRLWLGARRRRLDLGRCGGSGRALLCWGWIEIILRAIGESISDGMDNALQNLANCLLVEACWCTEEFLPSSKTVGELECCTALPAPRERQFIANVLINTTEHRNTSEDFASRDPTDSIGSISTRAGSWLMMA